MYGLWPPKRQSSPIRKFENEMTDRSNKALKAQLWCTKHPMHWHFAMMALIRHGLISCFHLGFPYPCIVMPFSYNPNYRFILITDLIISVTRLPYTSTFTKLTDHNPSLNRIVPKLRQGCVMFNLSWHKLIEVKKLHSSIGKRNTTN